MVVDASIVHEDYYVLALELVVSTYTQKHLL
jgi:hypothetical protein